MYSDCTCSQHAAIWRQHHPWGACAEVWAAGPKCEQQEGEHRGSSPGTQLQGGIGTTW